MIGLQHQTTVMTSYSGFVANAEDAVLLIEACRLRLLPAATRNLVSWERDQLIVSGSVFIFEEDHFESVVTRWRDGLKWDKSRIQGPFLVYRERDDSQLPEDLGDVGTSQQRERLTKRAVTVALKNGEKYHLISYYFESSLSNLMIPTQDPRLQSVQVDEDLYPELTRTALYMSKGKKSKKSKRHARRSAPPTISNRSPITTRQEMINQPSLVVIANTAPQSSMISSTPQYSSHSADYISYLENSIASCLANLPYQQDPSPIQRIEAPQPPPLPPVTHQTRQIIQSRHFRDWRPHFETREVIDLMNKRALRDLLHSRRR